MSRGTIPFVMRRRDRQRAAARRRRAQGVGIVLAVVLSILGGALILILTMTYHAMAADLPSSAEIERALGSAGREQFQPARFFDRRGEALLFTNIHPRAQARRWYSLNPELGIALPDYVVDAILAAVEPEFWDRAGIPAAQIGRAFVDALLQRERGPGTGSIAQRLAASQLLPLSGGRTDSEENLRAMLLAADLLRRYPKEKVLEWYLNSADFGSGAFGIDAAALVYFGKHAADLTLAESALLARIPLDPAINPFQDVRGAKANQRAVLQALLREGAISASQMERAQMSDLDFMAPDEGGDAFEAPVYAWMREELARILGPRALGRSGLRVFTTIDEDLQLQGVCALASQMARLNGASIEESVPARDGSSCLTADLLPTLRPGDAGVDHGLGSGSFIVIDNTRGEVLAAAGDIAGRHPAGASLMPLTYLTAFTQGYSPASMVLDIPQPGASGAVEASQAGGESYQGPVRIRTALIRQLRAAEAWLLDRIGLESVVRTAELMGLRISDAAKIDLDAWTRGDLEAPLLQIAFTYDVIAHQGLMVGAPDQGAGGQMEAAPMGPAIVREVVDAEERLIYRYVPAEKAVLSAPLAFLISDVLTDEAARWPLYGQGNPLEIGRPAGAFAGGADEAGNWTLGFTPSVTVGVRMRAAADRQVSALSPMSGAASVWHAIMLYAVRQEPPAGWSMPPGVSELEVCDPSGLLPTEYCPSVVRELFLNGTEPIQYDDLFQPFLINMETGKLATLNTPLAQVEERVYLIPPPEASAWAQASGLELPPQEYDTLQEEPSRDPLVSIEAPAAFSYLRDEVPIRGTAALPDMDFFRLQFGPGLNPTRWTQIGSDSDKAVRSGLLGRWDTDGLNGLYTVQLLVVLKGGEISTDAVHVTLDNEAPQVEAAYPADGQRIQLADGEQLALQAKAEDAFGVVRVDFLLDGRLVDRLDGEPFSTRIASPSAGEHELIVRAYDAAGNIGRSAAVAFTIVR